MMLSALVFLLLDIAKEVNVVHVKQVTIVVVQQYQLRNVHPRLHISALHALLMQIALVSSLQLLQLLTAKEELVFFVKQVIILAVEEGLLFVMEELRVRPVGRVTMQDA